MKLFSTPLAASAALIISLVIPAKAETVTFEFEAVQVAGSAIDGIDTIVALVEPFANISGRFSYETGLTPIFSGNFNEFETGEFIFDQFTLPTSTANGVSVFKNSSRDQLLFQVLLDEIPNTGGLFNAFSLSLASPDEAPFVPVGKTLPDTLPPIDTFFTARMNFVGAGSLAYDLTSLRQITNQDPPVPAVPLPASAWFLLAGVFGLVRLRQK